MPRSDSDSQEEDIALPDAPELSPSSTEADTVTKDEPTPSSPPVIPKKEGSHNIKLDDIFAEDEDLLGDTDFTDLLASEAVVAQKSGPDLSDPNIMIAFYQRLFPFRHLFQWLNHSIIPCNDFGHREFAFTLQNDAYLRYQAFPTFETLRKEVLRLNPSRFEIGPVYTANPRDRKTLSSSAFRPLHKELVFDIDLTDYDEVRTCCDSTRICERCWNFVTVAIKVLDVALKDDLGFKHVLWVYSGRRGAHAWVCDRRARLMDDTKRRAVATYLEVVKGGRQQTKKVNLKRPLHPHLARSLEILKENFHKNILQDQDPWREAKQAEKLLSLLPDKTLNDALRKKWESHSGRPSTSKWADIDALAGSGVSKGLNTQQLREAKQDIVLEYMYPRLDAEVSKHLNHLLKSPFCVHPGTGRVCVPIDSRRPEAFQPMRVPTVTELLKEIDGWNVNNEGDENVADYEKTSLKPYVEFFKTFVAGLMKEETKIKRERDEATNDFNAMEF